MTRYVFISFLIFLLINSINAVFSQADTLQKDGITLIIPSAKEKSRTSVFSFNAGYQLPAWTSVPMLPENPGDLVSDGPMKVKADGWFAGIGILKKTRSPIELGILADFMKSSVPVAMKGQRSESQWVLEKTGGVAEFTEVFDHDIIRNSEVIAIRATARYRFRSDNFGIWGGFSPGTFSTRVVYRESESRNAAGDYRETRLGLSFQSGIDYSLLNSYGIEKARISLVADIGGPRCHESYFSLFKSGWSYRNEAGNYAANPFRIGLAVSFL